MHRLSRLFGLAAVVVLSTGQISCSPNRAEKLPESGATLEGTVTYGKEKIEFAMILVQGANSSATGQIGEDGRYKVENVPLGAVKIGVNTSAARGQFQSKMMSQNAAAADPTKSGKISAPKFRDVPAKYFDPESSGFTKQIEKGTNTFDIVIP